MDINYRKIFCEQCKYCFYDLKYKYCWMLDIKQYKERSFIAHKDCSFSFNHFYKYVVKCDGGYWHSDDGNKFTFKSNKGI